MQRRNVLFSVSMNGVVIIPGIPDLIDFTWHAYLHGLILV